MSARIKVVVGVVVVLLIPAIGTPQDVPAGMRTADIPGWTVLIQQDPFTDEWKTGAAFGDGVAVLCDPTRETYPTGLRVMVSDLPRLFVDRADVEYRIGRGEPQVGSWAATWGSGGSTVTVPSSLIAEVLRAGRLAIRVQSQHTRLLEWANGGDVYALLSECAGWEQ